MANGDENAPADPYEAGAWAIVELMGHRVLPGFVQRVNLFGVPMVRITVPMPDGPQVHEHPPTALYGISRTTEEHVRARLARDWGHATAFARDQREATRPALPAPAPEEVDPDPETDCECLSSPHAPDCPLYEPTLDF